VSLDYQLSQPVSIDGETNFFLFAFDFRDPPLIDIGTSTVTYLATEPGVDFTQISFVCHTDIVPDPGCGSENPVEGITLNLERIPEPGTWSLLAYRNCRALPCCRALPTRRAAEHQSAALPAALGGGCPKSGTRHSPRPRHRTTTAVPRFREI
jgi:hypothetical protein